MPAKPSSETCTKPRAGKEICGLPLFIAGCPMCDSVGPPMDPPGKEPPRVPPKTHSFERGLLCPRCGGYVRTMYSNPPQFACDFCESDLLDLDTKSAIQVLTPEEAVSKRPSMYGGPSCPECSHEPHDGPCKWCIELRTEHVYDMVMKEDDDEPNLPVAE